MAQVASDLRPGMYGVDGNSEFKITNVGYDDVEIQYLSDGEHERLWVQKNRFVRQNGQLRLA